MTKRCLGVNCLGELIEESRIVRWFDCLPIQSLHAIGVGNRQPGRVEALHLLRCSACAEFTQKVTTSSSFAPEDDQ